MIHKKTCITMSSLMGSVPVTLQRRHHQSRQFHLQPNVFYEFSSEDMTNLKTQIVAIIHRATSEYTQCNTEKVTGKDSHIKWDKETNQTQSRRSMGACCPLVPNTQLPV